MTSFSLVRGQGRYDLDIGQGDKAFALVREEGDVVTVSHTEVPPHRRGAGLGARLVAAVLDDIRARGKKVRPRCPFAAAFIRAHPDYADLVAG